MLRFGSKQTMRIGSIMVGAGLVLTGLGTSVLVNPLAVAAGAGVPVFGHFGVVGLLVAGNIANDFVDCMGFTEASGKARRRWAAVNHGTSENGNRHIHLAVSLVREDGTKASAHSDYRRATAVRDDREMHRSSLARKDRASASASATEAEFVRQARDTGLLVRPRYDLKLTALMA